MTSENLITSSTLCTVSYTTCILSGVSLVLWLSQLQLASQLMISQRRHCTCSLHNYKYSTVWLTKAALCATSFRRSAVCIACTELDTLMANLLLIYTIVVCMGKAILLIFWLCIDRVHPQLVCVYVQTPVAQYVATLHTHVYFSVPMLCQVCLFVPKTLPLIQNKISSGIKTSKRELLVFTP